MVADVERTFEVEAPIEKVWELIADPTKRAEAISVVESYSDEGEEFVWNLELPIPVINGTVEVRTQDVRRNPPEYVKFVGRSKVMEVTGEHILESTDTGCRVTNRFVVNGKVPGVEKFFQRRIDAEIDNLFTMLKDELEVEPTDG
ncbi:SRPBCC family protein [Natronomonas halophila]|uniref:SRPBCC family protein n=1 Tax=Natronomonas halophila TaxID=2747817 RepID=UPI0015B4C00D|nr:SRPBCC family protein [Natronomonas halophila]QLD86736.1 SRPBCC family protein [Natronomonas halophila]